MVTVLWTRATGRAVISALSASGRERGGLDAWKTDAGGACNLRDAIMSRLLTYVSSESAVSAGQTESFTI